MVSLILFIYLFIGTVAGITVHCYVYIYNKYTFIHCYECIINIIYWAYNDISCDNKAQYKFMTI